MSKITFKEMQTAIASLQSRGGNILQDIFTDVIKVYNKNIKYNSLKNIQSIKKLIRTDPEESRFFTQVIIDPYSANKSSKADLVIWKNNELLLVELKNGSKFDKGKTQNIILGIETWNEYIKEHFVYDDFLVRSLIVCFDENQLKDIRAKLKDFTISGKKFCDMLELDYNFIRLSSENWIEYKFQQFQNGDSQWKKNEDYAHFLNGQAANQKSCPRSGIIIRRNTTLEDILNPSLEAAQPG